MNKITQEHKDLFLRMANEWSFKAFVLGYSEKKLLDKFLHGKYHGKTGKRTYFETYTDEEAIQLKEIREKWISYHRKEYDDKMPKQWADFKQHKY